MDFYYRYGGLIQSIIAYGLIILSLYAPIHLVYVFFMRVVYEDKRVTLNPRMLKVSSLAFLVLLVIMFPAYQRAKATCFYTSCQNNCRDLGIALKMYSNDHDGQYPKSLDKLTPYYIKEIPKYPHKREKASIIYNINFWEKPKDTYSPLYQVYNEPTGKLCRYTFCCAGENHKVMIQGNYPKYNSDEMMINSPQDDK